MPLWSRVMLPAGLLVVVMVIMLAASRGLLSHRVDAAADPGQPFLKYVAVPDYPAGSLSRGEEGRAVVLVRVDSAGVVLGATVARSSGHRELDSAAAAAAVASTISAYARGDRRIGAQTALAYAFDLAAGRASFVPVRPDESRLALMRDTVRTVDATAAGVRLPVELLAESLRGARVRVMVEADGSVSRVAILRGSGTSGGDSAVRGFAGRLRFGAPAVNGRPVRCWLELGEP